MQNRLGSRTEDIIKQQLRERTVGLFIDASNYDIWHTKK